MIKVQASNLINLKIAFDHKKVQKAFNSSIKKTATRTKTHISKKVRQIYEIKANKINAVTRINTTKHGAVITWIGTNVGLENFKALKRNITLNKPKSSRWGNKRIGVSVIIKKSNSRKLVKTGFQVAKLNNLIFERTGQKMKSDPNKDAIKRMSGISIPQMVNDDVTMDASVFVEREFPIQFERAFKFFVGKK